MNILVIVGLIGSYRKDVPDLGVPPRCFPKTLLCSSEKPLIGLV
jgi:hypothetical protein